MSSRIIGHSGSILIYYSSRMNNLKFISFLGMIYDASMFSWMKILFYWLHLMVYIPRPQLDKAVGQYDFGLIPNRVASVVDRVGFSSSFSVRISRLPNFDSTNIPQTTTFLSFHFASFFINSSSSMHLKVIFRKSMKYMFRIWLSNA